MRWDWLPNYIPDFIDGIIITLQLLGLSVVIGMLLAIPIGLVQVTGPRWLAIPARAFCTVIRGTPLLIQLWLLYYGLGSLFPMIPEIRESFLWPILRDAFPYAILAFSLSVAGYEGEVMRGAFKGVPKGGAGGSACFRHESVHFATTYLATKSLPECSADACRRAGADAEGHAIGSDYYYFRRVRCGDGSTTGDLSRL